MVERKDTQKYILGAGEVLFDIIVTYMYLIS